MNDSMGFYVAKQCVKQLIRSGKNVLSCRVLVMGATFKENVSDIRNSRVADLVGELKQFGISVDVTDPYARHEELLHEYGFGLSPELRNDYDAIVVAVNHKPYLELTEDDLLSSSNGPGILIDVKGIFRNRIKKMKYWSL